MEWSAAHAVGTIGLAGGACERTGVNEKTGPKQFEDSEQSLSLLALYSEAPGRVGKSDKSVCAPPSNLEATQLVALHEGHHHQKHHHADAAADLRKQAPPESSLRDGDIIFRSSSAFEEARAIQLVSKSPLTHCGILIKEDKDWYVYEAAQPVKKTLLKDFVNCDEHDKYVVRRLKDSETLLTSKAMDKMKEYLKKNVGKDYDDKFGWGDDRMYCSELVWKAYYNATRLKVGKIQMVGDFDLSDPLVKKHVDARYGKDVPVTEPTITPGALFDSRLLKTVK